MEHRHKNFLIAYANNTDLKFEFRSKDDDIDEWDSTDSPQFVPYLEYRIDDEYKHLRKWILDGKPVELLTGVQWDTFNTNTISSPIEVWIPKIPITHFRLKELTEVEHIISKSEYVPFNFSDAEFLIGKAIKVKYLDIVYSITGVRSDDVIINNLYQDYKYLMENYTFLDGSPCGKLKQ